MKNRIISVVSFLTNGENVSEKLVDVTHLKNEIHRDYFDSFWEDVLFFNYDVEERRNTPLSFLPYSWYLNDPFEV